jgi:hypothetical protein
MKQLFTLLSIFILVGCTITKRQFNSGYHIEWKKSYSKEKNDLDRQNLTDLKYDHSNNLEIQSESMISLIDSVNLSPQKNESIADELVIPETSSKEMEETEPVEFQNPPIQEQRVPEIQNQVVDEVERKVEPFTWAALGSIFLGLLLLLTIGFTATTLGILTGIGLLACIFSIVSFIRILRKPTIYKAKGLTWTLFFLSMAGIGAALLILVYFILIATNNIDL